MNCLIEQNNVIRSFIENNNETLASRNCKLKDPQGNVVCEIRNEETLLRARYKICELGIDDYSIEYTDTNGDIVDMPLDINGMPKKGSYPSELQYITTLCAKYLELRNIRKKEI